MIRAELSRDDVVTVAQAVEEFRDEFAGPHYDSNRALAERIRGVLPTGHEGTTFVLTDTEQLDVLTTALRRICTAGSLVPGDPLDDAYRNVGGGYGGLQEMAVKALELAGLDRQGLSRGIR